MGYQNKVAPRLQECISAPEVNDVVAAASQSTIPYSPENSWPVQIQLQEDNNF